MRHRSNASTAVLQPKMFVLVNRIGLVMIAISVPTVGFFSEFKIRYLSNYVPRERQNNQKNFLLTLRTIDNLYP